MTTGMGSVDLATPRRKDGVNEATCAECGRDILRPWLGGIQLPWAHWVEPMGHAAHPATTEPKEPEGSNVVMRLIATLDAALALPSAPDHRLREALTGLLMAVVHQLTANGLDRSPAVRLGAATEVAEAIKKARAVLEEKP